MSEPKTPADYVRDQIDALQNIDCLSTSEFCMRADTIGRLASTLCDMEKAACLSQFRAGPDHKALDQ